MNEDKIDTIIEEMFKTLTNDELKDLIEWMEEKDTDYTREILYTIILRVNRERHE